MRRRQTWSGRSSHTIVVGVLEHETADARPVVPVDDPAVEPVERGRDAALELARGGTLQFGPWKSASSSTCVMPRRSATVRLTVVLPEPGMPTT